MTPSFFLEYFAYFQVCRYVQIQSEEVKKRKKEVIICQEYPILKLYLSILLIVTFWQT